MMSNTNVVADFDNFLREAFIYLSIFWGSLHKSVLLDFSELDGYYTYLDYS